MRAPKVRTEIRKEQIAHAALAIISRDGFHRLSIAELARDVGVVPSAVYRHYRGKDEVLDAVLDLISERLVANVAAVRAEAPTCLERLRLLLLRHVRLVRTEIPIPRVVLSEEIFAGDPSRRKRAHRLFQRYLAGVADIVREGQAGTEVRPGLCPDTVSVMFLGLVQPAAILWILSEGDFDMAGHVERAWAVFAQAIRAETIRTGGTRLRARPGNGDGRAA